MTLEYKTKNIPKRMWVDQPSTLQPLHELHGTNVLAILDRPGTYRIFFLSGPIIEQEASPEWLSNGWVKNESKI